jgi:hypothetical protein
MRRTRTWQVKNLIITAERPERGPRGYIRIGSSGVEVTPQSDTEAAEFAAELLLALDEAREYAFS